MFLIIRHVTFTTAATAQKKPSRDYIKLQSDSCIGELVHIQKTKKTIEVCSRNCENLGRKKILKMNPLCKVCGDLAAGFHFGVFTCEGCKVEVFFYCVIYYQWSFFIWSVYTQYLQPHEVNLHERNEYLWSMIKAAVFVCMRSIHSCRLISCGSKQQSNEGHCILQFMCFCAVFFGYYYHCHWATQILTLPLFHSFIISSHFSDVHARKRKQFQRAAK